MAADVETARGAVIASEQKLALAEARAKLAEEFAQEQAESLRKVTQSNGRGSTASLRALSPVVSRIFVVILAKGGHGWSLKLLFWSFV